jgi:hypothetical protein
MIVGSRLRLSGAAPRINLLQNFVRAEYLRT